MRIVQSRPVDGGRRLRFVQSRPVEGGTRLQVGPILQTFTRFLQAMFAGALPTLADFGLSPPKVAAPKTSEQKAAAVAKAEATRIARGTTSKKQKLAIKGNVIGIQVTPITAPSPAAPAAQPAVTASNDPASSGSVVTK